MDFLRALQFQLLAESIPARAEQFEFSAKLADRKNLQAPRLATGSNLSTEGIVGVDDCRRTGGKQFLKQPHLRIKIIFQRGVVIKMVAREIGKSRRRKADAVQPVLRQA